MFWPTPGRCCTRADPEHAALLRSTPERRRRMRLPPGAEHDVLADVRKRSPALSTTPMAVVPLNRIRRTSTRPDGEVETVTAGLEIGQGGAHADAVHVVLRPQANTRSVRVMHVRILGEVCRDTGTIKRLLHGWPGRGESGAPGWGRPCRETHRGNPHRFLQFLEIG